MELNITIVLLGAGLVGSPMARDLSAEEGCQVVVVDIDDPSPALLDSAPGITTVRDDYSRPQVVRRVMRGADLVISAIRGAMGFATLRAVLTARHDVVGIALFPRGPL